MRSCVCGLPGLDAGSLACVRGLDGSCDDVGDGTGNCEGNAMVVYSSTEKWRVTSASEFRAE